MIYLFLLAAVRLSGKRTLGQVTVFDLVLLLIISEATQQAMTGSEYSVTDAVLIVATLVGHNRLSDLLALRSNRFDRLLNDAPLVLIDRGEVLEDRLRFGHVKRDDILEEARKTQGLRRLDEMRSRLTIRRWFRKQRSRRQRLGSPPAARGGSS